MVRPFGALRALRRAVFVLLLRLAAVHFLVTPLNMPATDAPEAIATITTGNQRAIIEGFFVRPAKASSVRCIVLKNLSVSDARRLSEAR